MVFENCRCDKNDLFLRPCVVTDDKRIEAEVLSFSGEVVRVDDQVQTGSERVFLAYERFFKNEAWDLIVNIQGDEPLLTSEMIEEIIRSHLESSFDIMTMVKKMTNDHDGFIDRNRVKVIFSKNTKKCHYFSRAPIPFDRDGDENYWYLHIGIYSYRPDILTSFSHASQTEYEKRESLEQLRALEIGHSIGAVETDKMIFGVDTPEDLKILEGVLRGKGK